MSEATTDEGRTVDEQIARYLERTRTFETYLERYHKAHEVEYDFCIKLKQHSEKDRREAERTGRIRVVALDLYDGVRYITGRVNGSAIYIDCRPTGPGASEQESKLWSDLATVAKNVMESQVHDIELGYPRVRRRFIKLAQAARAGAAKLEIESIGPYGVEVVPKTCDPRNLLWDAERFVHFNDPGCDELWEVVEADWDWFVNESGYDNVDKCRPDGDPKERPEREPPSVPKEPSTPSAGRRITLLVGWLKDDKTELPTETRSTLPPERWYMACPTCGYTEQDLVSSPGYNGAALPEMEPCPQCGMTPEGQPAGWAHRMETDVEVGAMRAYADGYRRVVIAKFCPEAGYLRDGPWPKRLTNFPYMLHLSDPFPIEPWGNSETYLNMDLSALKNASLRSGFEQMDRNRDITFVREDAFNDAEGEPYQFDGTGAPFAFYSSDDATQGIHHFQGSGLNQAFATWMDRLDSELGRFRGTGQVAAGAAEDLKGAAVGTVARLQETGDVPQDEKIKILREDEEQFFNRWFEMICGAWTQPRWLEATGPNGAIAWRLFDPSKTPKMRIRVFAAPSLGLVDKAKIDAAKALQGAPPSIIRLAAKDANLPKEIIDELLQMSAAGPMGGTGAGVPGADPGIEPGMPGQPDPLMAGMA